MNKTVNINLGNILFHIDEDAYSKLKRYLKAVERSLSEDSEGKKEILSDIEIRIGELLSEKLRNERQVVNMQHIEAIINVMGQPEDYHIDEEYSESYTSTSKTKNTKKLFRDGDDKFLGGVASGFAHYFKIDPLWMRILFIISPFITMGTAIIIYIILWALLPEASSSSEKLQMKGEEVTISNIEKTVKSELVAAGEQIKNIDFTKAKSGIQDILDTIGGVLKGIIKVFGKFIGGLLIFTGAITVIALLLGAFSLGSIEFLGFGNKYAHYPDFFMSSAIPKWILTSFLFIAIAIPFLALLILGVKIVSSNTKTITKKTNLTLFGIWIIAILGLLFSGIEYLTSNSYEGASIQKETLQIKPSDTLNIKMIGNDNLIDSKYLTRSRSQRIVLNNDEEKLFSSRVNLDIRKSNTDAASIKIRKKTKSRNIKKATSQAALIEYQFNLNQKNLNLNSYFLSDPKNKQQKQMVDVILYLPEGTTVFLDKSTKTFLDDVKNAQDIYDRNMANHYFKMTKKGFVCLDCHENIYKNDAFDPKDFQLNIDKNGVNIKVNGTSKTTDKINN